MSNIITTENPTPVTKLFEVRASTGGQEVDKTTMEMGGLGYIAGSSADMPGERKTSCETVETEISRPKGNPIHK